MLLSPAGSSVDSAIAWLRAATRAQHDAIEGVVDLSAMRHPAHYRCVLQGFAAFLPNWEREVAGAVSPAIAEWLRTRSRRRFLEQDLQALGVEPRTPCPAPVRLACAAHAMGSLYVLEGSALGGQVIAAELAAVGFPTAFFAGWGKATGAMWREFRLLLEHELPTAEARREAADAACLTFDALSASLRSSLGARPPDC